MQHFSAQTLNENWYENRWATPQLHQARPDIKVKRVKESDISTLSATGVPAPLRTFNRKPKQDTTGLIPDDGYRELQTTNQDAMRNPVVHVNKTKPILSMIHKYNVAELSLVDRPIETTKTGFGSVVPQHDGGHARRYFQTENRDFYGEGKKPTPDEANKIYKNMTATLSGNIHARGEDEQRNRQISNLVGEIYNKDYDPQSQTDVQRSWLYQQDPAVRVVNEGSHDTKQVHLYDIATSLPMGDGIHKTMTFDGKMGAYAKKGTDVTKGQKNAVITRK